MDNPQHYQPLSHALNPPQGHQATYTGMFNSKITNTNTQTTHREEEEEEEEDGDDEGLVEEQLNRHEPDTQSNPSSPQPKTTGTADTHTVQQGQQEDPNSQAAKRRPGRPRGSKNRKPRSQTISKPEAGFYATPAAVTPPQHPDVNAHNQQYYEFQWRVLNLCSEFYTAAEELVKATQPLVIAQSYQMGPGSKVDPLVMLNEAKRICDTLVYFHLSFSSITLSNPEHKLSNPSQLVASPPPPIYPSAPTLYQPLQAQPVASTSTTTRQAASTTSTPATSSVISNPTSFVMPLPTAQPTYPQYSMYAPPGQYPTTPYYQYPYVTPGAYYAQPQPQVSTPAQPQPAATQTQPVQTPQPQPEASTSTGITVSSASVITSGTAAGGNQGAWSDEETERLKKLAEENRSGTQTGEIDWDRVVGQWGNSRTRHQILIKATSLGLKESSSRGVKRRRDEGTSDAASPSVPPTPIVANTVVPSTTTTTTTPAVASNPTSTSPSHSQTASTPSASPALQNQQRPAPKPTSTLPWPMPTVAVNTPSPVIAATTTATQDQQRTSYYRARPSQDANKSTAAVATHPYMYQPNGNTGASRLGKENGK
ncbi:hypothetical protein C0995_011601 [Termitomyces sp. Mi166|nr:hypothetical protein C0995_011601 [Termitomyces sp. Mi166\